MDRVETARSHDMKAAPRRPHIRRDLTVAALITVAILAGLGPVAGNGFVAYDDDSYITDNPLVNGGLGVEAMGRAFVTFHSGNWHPATWISHMIDVSLWGMDARGHHATGLLIHLLASLLAYAALASLTDRRAPAAAVALLFAVHPLHVESVAWASERKDLLCALFWWAALWAWSAYARRPSTLRYLAALGLFALGLLSKPMAVTFPLVLLILDRWPLDRWAATRGAATCRTRRLLLEKVPFLLLSSASAVVTILAQRAGDAMHLGERIRLGARAANAAVSLVAYLGKAAVPADLAVLYPFPEAIPPWRILLAVALLCGITTLAVAARRTFPWLLSGWLWYLVTILPVLGLVQVGLQGMADRYTYLPLCGIFLAVAWTADHLLRRTARGPEILLGAAAMVAAILVPVTRAQALLWRDGAALFSHAIAVTRDNGTMRANLGLTLARRGDLAGAVAQYRRSLALQPASPETMNSLGAALGQLGRLREAETVLRAALRYKPDHAGAHSNLGIVLEMTGRRAEAVEHYRRALAIDPRHVAAADNLRLALGGDRP